MKRFYFISLCTILPPLFLLFVVWEMGASFRLAEYLGRKDDYTGPLIFLVLFTAECSGLIGFILSIKEKK